MVDTGWRIVLVTTIPFVAQRLSATLREMGQLPVAVITARREDARPDAPTMTDQSAPPGVDILLPHHRRSMEPLIRACRPDLLLCWGFPWKIPQAALDVPPLGSVNCHPALLPRHRGPVPLAWAIRAGDGQYGVSWHRMDAELDTGPLLAQAAVPMQPDDFEIEVVGPRLGGVAIALLPRVLARVAAGDPGDPQPEEGASWAGHFGEDYATVDWSRPARAIHDQVRAWRFTFGLGPVAGPIATIDGVRVRLTRTSLTDPGAGARRMQAADGPLWIVASEPLPATA